MILAEWLFFRASNIVTVSSQAEQMLLKSVVAT
jgi:hypothetical protein